MAKKFAARVAVYVLGLFILAFGVVFAINSDLGISPVNSLPFAIHLASGVDMGLSVTAFFLFCIALQIALLRREFKWVNLTQIVFSTIFGAFVDVARFFMGDFSLGDFLGYPGQLMMLAISIALIALGLAAYMEARLVNLPPEGVVQAIADKIPGGKFHRVKIAMDSVLVVMAIAVTLVFLGGVYGAREGTVLSAIFIGKTIPVARKVATFVLGKTGFYAGGEAQPPGA